MAATNNSSSGPGGPAANSERQQPPSLPPRPSNYGQPYSVTNNSLYPMPGSMYSTSFNQYSPYNNFPSMYSGYQNYGIGGGYGMNPYGVGAAGTDPTNAFIRIAEESSRGAFQSVESVVHTFASISNMLESTLGAFYSSFRAILAVADQFSQLKVQLTSTIASLGLVKLLVWFYRRILVILRLKPANYAAELDAWADASTASRFLDQAGGAAASATGTNWPSIAFVAITIGGPWLLYRMIQKIVNNVEEKRKWATGESAHYEAKALFNFNAGQPSELSLRTGDSIRIAPKELQPTVRGWVLASADDGQRIGLVPINHIEIIARRDKTPANRQPGQNLDRLYDSQFGEQP